MTDNLTREAIKTNNTHMFHNESSPSISTPKTTLTGPQSQRQNQSPQNHQVCFSIFTYLLNTNKLKSFESGTI